MDALEMLKAFNVLCPSCGGDLEIKAEDYDSRHILPLAYVEQRTTITPIFQCPECSREYIPSITLSRRIKHINMVITTGQKQSSLE